MATRSWVISVTVALGLLLAWLGERVVDANSSRAALTGAGAGLVLLSTLVRLRRRSRTDRADLRRVETLLALLHAAVLAGLALYGVQSDLWAKASDQALSVGWPTLANALAVLWPAVVATALLPMLLVELALTSMMKAPRLEIPRVYEAMYSGLGLASALVFAFSAQYVATELDVRKDVAYFRTTRPGEATVNMVQSLDEPLEVHLFFPPANEVGELVRGYFDELRAASPKLVVSEHDQPLEPVLSKDLGVSSNGNVVLRRGARKESAWVGTEIERARAPLRSLDADIQKRLLQVAKSRRTVYLTAGHGERLKNPLSQGDTQGTIAMLYETLQNLNFEVRPLSAAEGLGQEVPNDAAAVFLVGPTHAFSEPEARALEAYAQRGGRLFLALDPEAGLSFSELTTPLGVTFVSQVLCDDKNFARTSRQFSVADRRIIGTRSYSSHPSVSTLGKSQTPVWLLGAGSLEENPQRPTGLQVDVSVRSDANAWSDLNGNFEAETPPEVRKGYGVLAAVTRRMASKKPEDELRALVLADADAISDQILSQAMGNQFLVVDGLKWLLGEEHLQGATSTEQDVPLTRSQSQDKAWFYATLFLAPIAVLALGSVVRRRPRRVAGKAQKEPNS
jgi:hypothetical protein